MLNWMSGARHNVNTTVAHCELSVNHVSLGMASNPDPDTTLTLLLFTISVILQVVEVLIVLLSLFFSILIF